MGEPGYDSRSCPSCHSIGPPKDGCQNLWHVEVRPSHAIVPSPSKPRPADPLARELADGLRTVAHYPQREGSAGRTLEEAKEEWILRALARTGHGEPVPARMVMGRSELWCEDHGQVLHFQDSVSLRTLMFEARRHWREQHQ